MTSAKLHPRETERIEALEACGIMDSSPEEAYDDLTLLAAELCDAPIAGVTLIDRERQWFKAKVGVEPSELPRDLAFCAHVVALGEALVVEDLRKDERFADHPFVVGPALLVFYAGIPVRAPDGLPLGALCVLDHVPRRLTSRQLGRLRVIARQVEVMLELRMLRDADYRARTEARAAATRTLVEQHQRELHASQELFRNAFENAAMGMAVISLDRRFLRVNRALAALLGTTEEQLLTTTLRDVMHGDDHVSPEVWVGELIDGHADSTRIERRFLRADASSVWTNASVSLVRDAAGAPLFFVAQILDITAQKRAEDSLRASEAEFRLLAEHATDIISRHGPDGTYRYITPSVRRLRGYAPEDLYGTSPFDLYHVDDLAPMTASLEAIMTRREPRTVSHRSRCADGTYRWFETAARPVEDPVTGEVVEIHCVSRDISQRKEAEEALKSAKEEAESASRAKMRFLANMTHELRTPLNAILGFSQVLQKGRYGVLNERQRQYVCDVIESGEHMLALVEQLLELRRMEEKRGPDAIVAVALAPAVEEAVRMAGPLSAQKHQAVVVSIDPDVGPVYADRRALVQVLVNLLTNAAKYTGENGRIEVRARIVDQRVAIDVEDDGVGIAEADLARVFDYFEQVGGGRAGHPGGYGLGLALARKLVERQGGTIDVRSSVGHGSTFTFTLRSVLDHETERPKKSSR